MKKRILYFHQHFSTPSGYTGIRSYQMAKRLIESGHSVTMVCGRYGAGATDLAGEYQKGCRRGNVEGIDVIEFDLAYSNRNDFLTRSWVFVLFALRSIKLVFTEKYDLIFATSTPLTAGIPGIFSKLLRRKEFVFEVRDLWPELPRAMGVITNPVVLSALSLLEWLSYKTANRLVGLSPGIVEGIRKRNIGEDRVMCIPNGCDLTLFRPDADDSAAPWRPAEVDADDYLAVFTGAHGIANGLQNLISVAAELKQRGREDIKILLVGDGMQKANLIEQASSQSLTNIVFHDPVPKTKLVGLMKSADIGLQVLANVPAFYYGTSPNKFFDYISAALPVIINYPGWLAELVNEHDCGLAVPPDDPQAYADALIYAADHRQDMRDKGQQALRLAERSFDREKLSAQFVAWVVDARRERLQ